VQRSTHFSAPKLARCATEQPRSAVSCVERATHFSALKLARCALEQPHSKRQLLVNSCVQRSTHFSAPKLARCATEQPRSAVSCVERSTHFSAPKLARCATEQLASFSSQLCSESHTFQRAQARPPREMFSGSGSSRLSLVAAKAITPSSSSTSSSSKKNPLKQRTTDYFVKKGFKAADIPKAIFFHEILGLLMLAITWSSCYYLEPSKVRLVVADFSRGHVSNAAFSHLFFVKRRCVTLSTLLSTIASSWLSL
jgi:hypothetical protein